MMISRNNKAVVETNHVSAVRTGNIKAQYPAKTDMENGMALFVDDAAKEIRLATPVDQVLYLHASEEQVYEEHLGRNSFYIKANQYPRALKLEVGDIFETNALLEVESEYLKGDQLRIQDGFWAKASSGTAVAVIVDLVVLPNGENGAKIAMINPVSVVG